MGLTNVIPDEWGTVSVKVNGTKINDKGILGVEEVNVDQGAVALDGTQIPIGATLNAIGKLQAMSRAEQVSYRVSEFLDGLLDMGAIKFKSSAMGIAYLPLVKTDPIFHIANASIETGTESFRDS